MIHETLPEEVSAGKTIVESLNESLPVNTTDGIDRQEEHSQENIPTARNLHGGLNKRCDEGSVAEQDSEDDSVKKSHRPKGNDQTLFVDYKVSGENLSFFDLM